MCVCIKEILKTIKNFKCEDLDPPTPRRGKYPPWKFYKCPTTEVKRLISEKKHEPFIALHFISF